MNNDVRAGLGVSTEIEDFLRFGHETLAEAGRIAAHHFRRPLAPGNKAAGAGFDPVTAADRAVEAHVRQRIEARYPTHGISGEEFGAKAGASAWSWILDPIDGTRSFIVGLPAWGCLLGLLQDGEPTLGFMHQPLLGETFSGDGERAWITQGGQRRAIEVRTNAGLADAILGATHPSMFKGAALARFEALAARTRMMRYGGDCYNYCLLAHGLMDLVVEDDLKPHDILPLVPIVRGAGGWLTDLEGATPRGGRMVVAAANQALHREALDAMKG